MEVYLLIISHDFPPDQEEGAGGGAPTLPWRRRLGPAGDGPYKATSVLWTRIGAGPPRCMHGGGARPLQAYRWRPAHPARAPRLAVLAAPGQRGRHASSDAGSREAEVLATDHFSTVTLVISTLYCCHPFAEARAEGGHCGLWAAECWELGAGQQSGPSLKEGSRNRPGRMRQK